MSALRQLVQRALDLRHTQFFKDTVVLQIATLVQVATYTATSVMTARYLGEVDLGRWNSSREIYQLAWFLVSAGVVNATVSKYSESVGRQDRAECVNALAAMLRIGSLTSLAVLVAGFALGPWVGRHFYNDSQVGWYGAVLCVAGLFEVVRGLTVAALLGTRQMREYAWFDMTTNLLRTVVVWAVLAMGWGMLGVVAAFLLHMVVAGGMALRWYARARDGHAKLAPPPLREVIAAVPHARIRHIFGIGYLIALNKTMATVVPRFGLLLIPALPALSQAEAFEKNGHYGIAQHLSWGLSLALTGVVQTLLPTLGLKLGSQNRSFGEMGGVLRRVSLVSGGLMIAATVLSVPVVYVVIHVFYGPEFADSFQYYLWITTGNLFMGFTTVIEPFYIYSGKLKLAVPINLALATLALIGIILAGHYFGPIGVAAGAGLCRSLPLLHLVYMGAYFRRERRRLAGR